MFRFVEVLEKAKRLHRVQNHFEFLFFLTQKTKTRRSQEETTKDYPEASSVIFLSSRPNQSGLNGRINFKDERKCEIIIRNLKQEPPKNGLRFSKTGKHVSPERTSMITKQPDTRVFFNNWFEDEFECHHKDLVVRYDAKNRETKIQKL